MSQKKRKNPFLTYKTAPTVEFKEREYIRYKIEERVCDGFDSKRPSEFLIDKATVECERIPIDEYIDSFSSKVGLANELKGIVTKSQMDEYIAAHRAEPGYVDLTKLPDSALEMAKLASRADSIYESLPEELRGKMTKEEFIKSFDEEKFNSYINSKVAESQKVSEKGENE